MIYHGDLSWIYPSFFANINIIYDFYHGFIMDLSPTGLIMIYL